MISPKFLGELQRFSLIVNKRVTSKYSGERKSTFSGAGTIFRDHRQYALGDNYKAIDWRVYARTDDLYIKVFEEERNLEVHVLVDSSASMAYREKFDYAGMVGLGMSFLALKNNERVHLSTFSDKLQIIKGRKGANQIVNLMNEFNKIKPEGKSDLFKTMLEYKRYVHTKSLIIIVSDFLMPKETIENALSLFRKGHKVMLVQVLDTEEKQMPLEGDFKFIDSESDVKLKTYVSKRSQQQYLERLNQHVDFIKSIKLDAKISFNQFSTEESIFDSFFVLAQQQVL